MDRKHHFIFPIWVSEPRAFGLSCEGLYLSLSFGKLLFFLKLYE